MMKLLALALVCAIPPSLPAAAQQGSAIERGKFRLHKFEQPIGEETYEIRRDGNSLATKIDFQFTDRGTAASLSATSRGAVDSTPESFEIKGKTSRKVPSIRRSKSQRRRQSACVIGSDGPNWRCRRASSRSPATLRYRTTTVLLNARRGSEQYHSTNSSIACRYPR
jgi:hypothetical protein